MGGSVDVGGVAVQPGTAPSPPQDSQPQAEVVDGGSVDEAQIISFTQSGLLHLSHSCGIVMCACG